MGCRAVAVDILNMSQDLVDVAEFEPCWHVLAFLNKWIPLFSNALQRVTRANGSIGFTVDAMSVVQLDVVHSKSRETCTQQALCDVSNKFQGDTQWLVYNVKKQFRFTEPKETTRV